MLKVHANTITLLRAIFGDLGIFLLVAVLGLILQKWRRKNAEKCLSALAATNSLSFLTDTLPFNLYFFLEIPSC